ncbi:hypothetical protein FKG94_09250 [Exilibacterium tricleocarpae]|uniref:Uncharacterized protein n=1 Tax=Exilibacterium tricleocarpae TaxID=2591008 RepID=A0A545TVN3_9GAMM|nr:hypothetical protein [Exilibacterium tricleocarpae]TQV81273.1 hypothetical protein FKG94_09250 [Exilibacterium tricleocarpae]
MQTSISDAISTLEELLSSLDNAYWEAATMERKDLFYDIISAVNHELSELAKLSVQDHNLEYEPITVELREAGTKLSNLRKLLDECVLRSRTATKLEALLSDAIALASDR